MVSRRKFLGSSLGLLAGKALLGQQSATAPKTQDEMGLNTAQTRPVYPPPDFGPAPATLPAEALAVRGRKSLREHALHHGLLAGCAVGGKVLQTDAAMSALVGEQYSILVSEGSMKWIALRPAKDTFRFEDADALFAYAAAHSMKVRGHTLVWHNSVPRWLEEGAATFDVRALLEEHIRTVMGRYRGRVHSWDVVNEAILPADKQPGGMRNSFWYEHAGHDYIDLAYRIAREADPHAKLCYNDYGVEYDNDDNAERRRLILELLRGMQARKVPLDAVGIQSHIHAASKSSIGAGLREYMAAIHDMGLEVYLTELDVNEDDIANADVAERDAQVAATYAQFLDVALASPAVKLVLTWGVSDRRTWLNDGPTHHRKQPNRPQRSLPFDPQYRPAPAFFAMRDAFDRRKKTGGHESL